MCAEFNIGAEVWQVERQYHSKHDPENPPPHKPGDKLLVTASVVGGVIGAGLGIFASRYFGLFLFDIIIGTILGGISGLAIGSMIYRIVNNRRAS